MAQSTREFYLNAIARSGAINAASFARKVGIGEGTLSDWKKGRSYPSDKTMLKIALICDLDPAEALALLNLWRCDEAARGAYERLLHAAKSAALKCFPFMIVPALALQGNSLKPLNYMENQPAQISHNSTISSLCDN